MCCVEFDIALPCVRGLRLGLVPVANAPLLLLRNICQDELGSVQMTRAALTAKLEDTFKHHFDMITVYLFFFFFFFHQQSILQQQMEMLLGMFVQECHSSLSSEITH